MTIKGIYSFDSMTDTGINELPVQSLVKINNNDGSDTANAFTLLSKANILPSTSVGDVYTNPLLAKQIHFNVLFDYDFDNNNMNIIIKDI